MYVLIMNVYRNGKLASISYVKAPVIILFSSANSDNTLVLNVKVHVYLCQFSKQNKEYMCTYKSTCVLTSAVSRYCSMKTDTKSACALTRVHVYLHQQSPGTVAWRTRSEKACLATGTESQTEWLTAPPRQPHCVAGDNIILQLNKIDILLLATARHI